MTYESIQAAQTSIEAGLEHLTYSAYLFCLAEDLNTPIVSLDSRSRIAFLLHHVLGYRIEDAAVLTGMSEQEFREDLRGAYLQLASREFESNGQLIEVPAEPALA